jgi:hypothetical protein
VIQPAASGRCAASSPTTSPSRSASQVHGPGPATRLAACSSRAPSVPGRSVTLPKSESQRMISRPSRATVEVSPGSARRISRPPAAAARSFFPNVPVLLPAPPGAARAARTSSGASPWRSSADTPSTSRQGQSATAAVSGSAVPCTPARCSRHRPSSPSRPRATPGPATSAHSLNLRAAPQDRSRLSGGPAQCSQRPAAAGPSGPLTISGAPQPGAEDHGTAAGSSGSIRRQRSSIRARTSPAGSCAAGGVAADDMRIPSQFR